MQGRFARAVRGKLEGGVKIACTLAVTAPSTAGPAKDRVSSGIAVCACDMMAAPNASTPSSFSPIIGPSLFHVRSTAGVTA